jgi:Trk-type K+ transport system membrane component
MTLNEFRERANIFLYGHKEQALFIGKFLNVIVSLLGLLTMVYYYGYPHTPEEKIVLIEIIKGSFAYYVFHYLLRFVYDFHPLEFLKRTWIEALMMFILVIEAISYNFFDVLLLEYIFKSLGIVGFSDFSVLFIQGYFFTVLIVELQRSTNIIPRFKVHPSYVFIAIFLILMVGGALLLIMPEMSTVPGGVPFLDALFASTSAATTTGLMVSDTPITYTFKGQVVLLILIKLGGLNLITFGSFIFLASRVGIQVKQHDLIEDFVNKSNFLSADGLVRKTLIWTSAIELTGALMLYFSYDSKVPFGTTGDKIFNCLFHSISAFNNAGISVFSNGFFNEYIRFSYFSHWVLMLLIFFGSLGMLPIYDLFDLKNLRDRLKFPWKRISFSTKISLYVSLWLIFIGAVLFYFLETNRLFVHDSLYGKITSAMFLSVSPRSAGFNTVDLAALTTGSIIITCLLMLIGASSGSTGGGIKTSSFAIIYANILATAKGMKNTELYKRTISNVLVARVYSIFMFYIILIFVSVFLLSITEEHWLAAQNKTIIDLVFEEISAIGTVGLTTGVTGYLSEAGKTIIIFSMFIGRIGTLTIAFLIFGRYISKDYKYPEGHTMVG